MGLFGIGIRNEKLKCILREVKAVLQAAQKRIDQVEVHSESSDREKRLSEQVNSDAYYQALNAIGAYIREQTRR